MGGRGRGRVGAGAAVAMVLISGLSVAGAANASLAAAGATPPDLVAHPESSGSDPLTLIPGSAPQTIAIVNEGGSPSAALTVSLAATLPAAFQVIDDRCSGRTLKQGRSCIVRVGYVVDAAPTVDETAVLAVTSDHKKKGATSRSYFKVLAENRPPVADDDVASVTEDTAPNPVAGNVLANDSDPDGDTLSVTSAGTFTLSYGTLILHADGSYTYTLDNTNPAVNALDTGQTLTDTFTYTISDGHGGTDTAKLTITIRGNTD